MPPSQFARFTFSSTALAPEQRLGVVREVIGREMGMDIDIFPDRPIHAAFDFLNLPGVQTFSGETLAVGRRTPRLIADGNDLVGLALGTRGNFVLAQRGHQNIIASDAGAAISWADVLTVRSATGAQNGSMGVLMPRALLTPLVPGLEDAFGRPIPGGNEALRLLAHYVTTLQGMAGLHNPALAETAVRHIADLAALAIGAGRDAAMLASGRGLRAGRLNAIKTHIAANLGRHELSVGSVAAHHHLTPRYVQRLFEASGTTFSEYLLEQRLQRAHALLVNPLAVDRTIGLISYECGFGEVTYFNRTFRRRFGETPSDVRHAQAWRDKDLT